MLMKRVLLVLALMPAWLAALPASAAAPSDAQVATARVSGLAWLIANQQSDGTWQSLPSLETLTTASGVEALCRAGVRGIPLAAALSWLGDAPAPSTDDLAAKIFAMSCTGADTTLLEQRLLTWSLTNPLQGTGWGSYTQEALSVLDTAKAVAALQAAAKARNVNPDPKVSNATCALAGAKLPQAPSPTTGSSWPYAQVYVNDALAQPITITSPGALLPTANALFALTLSRTVNCGSVTVAQALSDGFTWLLANRRNPTDGGFGDPTGSVIASSPLETAAAYRALSSYCPAPIPPAVEPACPVAGVPAARDAALGYLVASKSSAAIGGWGSNALITGLVALTLPGGALPDTDGDGIVDAVEILRGQNPQLATRQFVANSGQGGVVSPFAAPPPLTITIPLNKAFTWSFVPVGGIPPYTWSLVSGVLPTGLNGLQGSSGSLSGTPTVVNIYPFVFRVTDSANTTATVSNRIEVQDPVVTRKRAAVMTVLQLLLN